MSRDESMELLSAFLDGEEIDPRELAQALSVPGARGVLRDFALLRAEIRQDEERPGAAFYERMQPILEGEAERPAWWRRVIPVPTPALAAATVIVALLAGWALVDRQLPRSERPPQADRIVRFETGVDWTVKQ